MLGGSISLTRGTRERWIKDEVRMLLKLNQASIQNMSHSRHQNLHFYSLFVLICTYHPCLRRANLLSIFCGCPEKLGPFDILWLWDFDSDALLWLAGWIGGGGGWKFLYCSCCRSQSGRSVRRRTWIWHFFCVSLSGRPR
jgi:hypothetical protein